MRPRRGCSKRGLVEHHPGQHERLEHLPPAPGPDVQVQTRLREQTIAITDQVKGWAGKIVGSSSGLGGAGALAWITEKATAVSGAKEAIGGLGIPPQAIVWLLVELRPK